MIIVHIQNINNQLSAILGNGSIVSIKDIKGSPRLNCNIENNGEGWSVAANTVDEDCVGGACPLK